MITILIILAIVGNCFYRHVKGKDEFYDFALIAVLITIGLLGGVATVGPKVEFNRVNYSKPIFSLKNQSEISGAFILGTGSFEGQEVYTYFYQDNRGAFCKENINTRFACLFEKENIVPTIYWQEVFYCSSRWIFPIRLESSEYTKRDIYVPCGTIIQKFNIQ
jgi:hypothetical protein